MLGFKKFPPYMEQYIQRQPRWRRILIRSRYYRVRAFFLYRLPNRPPF